MQMKYCTWFALSVVFFWQQESVFSQPFYFGADLSYVNEMEDCGVEYQENYLPKDPYQIFADHNCNLVRLRLWHTPAWYDSLNSGRRYSDLADVQRSIRRAKAAGMQVLLDFHLSDNWADPDKQSVPNAWLGIVDDLPLLEDSLYHYITQVLMDLSAMDLLPEMVQIGNETNKGILLSPADDAAGRVLHWARNARLFNQAIRAVRDVARAVGKEIKVALHVAGPADMVDMIGQFWNNGVRDFDIIGMSYYWAWHKPATVRQTGEAVAKLVQTYPGKAVMVLETGYIWTLAGNDEANNIISDVEPNYSPASPESQRRFLIDLTQEVIDRGGSGVIYWEPAWVSSPCRTQWGRGSHQENAAFFDFDTNLIPDGGIAWMTHDYQNLVSTSFLKNLPSIKITPDSNYRILHLEIGDGSPDAKWQIGVVNAAGQVVTTQSWAQGTRICRITLPDLPAAIYFVTVQRQGQLIARERVWLHQN